MSRLWNLVAGLKSLVKSLSICYTTNAIESLLLWSSRFSGSLSIRLTSTDCIPSIIGSSSIKLCIELGGIQFLGRTEVCRYKVRLINILICNIWLLFFLFYGLCFWLIIYFLFFHCLFRIELYFFFCIFLINFLIFRRFFYWKVNWRHFKIPLEFLSRLLLIMLLVNFFIHRFTNHALLEFQVNLIMFYRLFLLLFLRLLLFFDLLDHIFLKCIVFLFLFQLYIHHFIYLFLKFMYNLR